MEAVCAECSYRHTQLHTHTHMHMHAHVHTHTHSQAHTHLRGHFGQEKIDPAQRLGVTQHVDCVAGWPRGVGQVPRTRCHGLAARTISGSHTSSGRLGLSDVGGYCAVMACKHIASHSRPLQIYSVTRPLPAPRAYCRLSTPPVAPACSSVLQPTLITHTLQTTYCDMLDILHNLL